ncbi:MAG: hypothetical protein FJ405_15235 [Verrucomicrobia bacterium]|nr:hypothetical protein [Verrucomicrobiota bacterium]
MSQESASNQWSLRETCPVDFKALESSGAFRPILEDLRTSARDIDADAVRRARKLLEQDGYPSPEVLEQIARALARGWPAAET